MSEADNILEAALAYAEHGWPIFPVRHDKRPYPGTHGVLEATTDPRQIRVWWDLWPEANVALDVGGACMMVLDCDPGHDMKELEKNVGKIPITNLRSVTPRGGQHLFYNLMGGELVSPSSSKLASHVDVRSFHSYVLLPPSETQDGTYSWEADGKPAHRTDEMVRAANTARDKHEDRDRWTIEADLGENIQRAKKWLTDEAKSAIEGQGGDHCAYATAVYLKSLGISQEKAVDLMWEYWNPRCRPPWGEDEHDHLNRKIENAYRYNTSPPGNLTPGYRKAQLKESFQMVRSELSEGEESRVAGFRFVDRAGMDHIPPPEWLIKDFILDDSYAMIFGSWGSFKTFVALDLALSLACGFPADPTWEVVRPGPVLFAAGEGRSALTRRVAGWEALHFCGTRVDDFVLVDPVPTTTITEEAIGAFVGEALRRHPGGYSLTVLDTLGKAMLGADENAQRDASQMTALVQRLRTELGGSVLVLHHSGLADASRPRGSSVIGADADTIVRSVRRGRDRLVTLHMTKQKDAPEWDKPRLVRLYDSSAFGGGTLAAGPPREDDRKNTKEAKARDQDTAVLEVVEREVRAVLEANPLRCWTQRDLAEAVAMRDAVSVDSKTLSGHYLVRLRESKSPAYEYAKSAYDPARNRNAGRWRHPG